MIYWKIGILGIACVITALLQTPVYAQTIEVSGRGGGVYDTETGEYSAFTLLDPLGITFSEGLAAPTLVGADPDGTLHFEWSDFGIPGVISTKDGDIHYNASGIVTLTPTGKNPVKGQYTGEWTGNFVVSGGTGIFEGATGELNGIAINPPVLLPDEEKGFYPKWKFSWEYGGLITLAD